MTLHSPLTEHHLNRDASLMPYPDPADPSRFAEVIEAFGPIELEYAAIRKGCVLIDQPQRGTITITGKDRLDFLNRLFTQELKDLASWESRRSFWLNRKGRIDADLRVTALPDVIQLDVDIHAAARTIETLESYLFTEDISLTNESECLHRLGLHGPAALAHLGRIAEHDAGPELERLAEGCACRVTIAGHETLVERFDWLGEIGLELSCETEHAVEVYDALLDAGPAEEQPTGAESVVRAQPIGWHACNIARIEAGTPLYYLDFGTESLPHQTGLLHDRVSFTKGCYLGQEIIARMESRGHSKPLLVGMRFEHDSNPDLPQPLSGDEVFVLEPTQASGAGVSPANTSGAGVSPASTPIGQITSSTISPMLGSVPICFALVRHAHTSPGTRVAVATEGERITATVQPELVFWKRG